MKPKLRSNSGKTSDRTMAYNLQRENVKLRRDVAIQKKRANNVDVPSIPTKNRFASLDQNNQMNWNDEVDQANGNSSTKANKVSRPPPIKITDDRLKTTDIKTFLNDLHIESFRAKSISIGIKVDLDTKEDYEKCVANLTEEKIAFFTHRDKDQKSFKVVLSGLPRIGIEIIVDEMKQYNIEPTTVTELATKVTNPNHCLYLVQFTNKEVTLNHLRKIRSIDHIIVNGNLSSLVTKDLLSVTSARCSDMVLKTAIILKLVCYVRVPLMLLRIVTSMKATRKLLFSDATIVLPRNFLALTTEQTIRNVHAVQTT